MKRAAAGYAGALVGVALFVAGLILMTFGLIFMGHPVFGLVLLPPGAALLIGGGLLFRKSLWF